MTSTTMAGEGDGSLRGPDFGNGGFERHREGHGYRHHGYRHHRHGHNTWQNGDLDGGGYGVPDVIPGVGTYAGTVSALQIRGTGTYYYAEGLGGDAEPILPGPSAKVIHVERRKDPCSYEAGVCVIRP